MRVHLEEVGDITFERFVSGCSGSWKLEAVLQWSGKKLIGGWAPKGHYGVRSYMVVAFKGRGESTSEKA